MTMSQSKIGPILLTGAAGALGTWLREHLAKRPGGVRSTDVRAFGPPVPGETIAHGDLGDSEAVERMVGGASAVGHFGAVTVEDSCERILRSKIVGPQKLFGAA